jgi:tetratricopeptide (TPR) repeat protein
MVQRGLRALEFGPDNAAIFVGPRLSLLTSGQATRAVAAFDQAIAKSDADPTTYLLRGTALQETGELDRALADLDHALQLRPRFADALTERGAVWMKKKDYARALTDLDQSIAVQPSVLGYFARAQVHETQGKSSLAIADFRKALELQPKNVFDVAAQAFAKSRLEVLSRRDSCGGADDGKGAGRCL